MSTSLSYSFTAGEVLPLGTTISIKSPVSVDVRSARNATSIRQSQEQYRVELRLADENKTINISTDILPPGKYALVINGLLGAKGERFSRRIVIPFKLDKLAGQVPSSVRVEKVTRIQIGELHSKQLRLGQEAEKSTEFVEFVKYVENNKPKELAFDRHGQRIDGNAKINELKHRRLAKFGRLHENLHDHIQGKQDHDTVDVTVWPHLDRTCVAYDKPTHQPAHGPTSGEKQADQEIEKRRSIVMKVLHNHGVKIQSQRTKSPAIHAVMTVSQVQKLKDADPDQIGVVLLDDTHGFPDLANSQAISRADVAHNRGFSGNGVKVAVFEDGPSVLNNLVFDGQYQANPPASDHARLTNAIIKNTEPGKPHGYAQDCSLYSANSFDNAALQWALDQGCTVISQSFHRGNENNSATIQPDDILKDWMVLRYPFPTIVQAAGNIDFGAASEYVNHKGYNSINAGSHDDTATFMAADSDFQNPTSAHGDRELPEIAANGTAVTANDESMSGTSFAAPAVAGAAALIQGVNSVLRSWPEGCRAILLASAGRNVSGSTWYIDVSGRHDAADGAGALDCDSACLTAQSPQGRDNAGVARGWNVGTLTTADFTSDTLLSTFRYNVRTPNFGGTQTCTVQVALAWDSVVASTSTTSVSNPPTATTLTLDFDLLVYTSDGTLVAFSSSWDNSYEIVTFNAQPNTDYSIAIRRFSGTDNTWYGLAWVAAVV
jgi:hypothetical protein